jgi:hypothetical protein
LARFGSDSRNPEVHALLRRAITGYLGLAQASLESGSVADAQLVVSNVSNLLPELTERDRPPVMEALRAIEERLAARK